MSLELGSRVVDQLRSTCKLGRPGTPLVAQPWSPPDVRNLFAGPLGSPKNFELSIAKAQLWQHKKNCQ